MLFRSEKPIVQGWRLGKAQELLHHLLAEGFDLAVEQSIYRVAEVYEERGIDFPGVFRRFDGSWSEGQVLVCPPGRRSTEGLHGLRGKRFMELTGWASARNGRGGWASRADASLPYSDHADFKELVAYVGQVQPQRVYTVNGFPELATHLRSLGYLALHLDGQQRSEDIGVQMKLL